MKMVSRITNTSASAFTLNYCLAIALATVLICSNLTTVTHGYVAGDIQEVHKRSFLDIDCKGSYEKEIFSQLERVCDDCYALYREPQLHYLCRSNCFGSSFFKGCLDALLWSEDAGKYEQMIEILGKK